MAAPGEKVQGASRGGQRARGNAATAWRGEGKGCSGAVVAFASWSECCLVGTVRLRRSSRWTTWSISSRGHSWTWGARWEGRVSSTGRQTARPWMSRKMMLGSPAPAECLVRPNGGAARGSLIPPLGRTAAATESESRARLEERLLSKLSRSGLVRPLMPRCLPVDDLRWTQRSVVAVRLRGTGHDGMGYTCGGRVNSRSRGSV